MPSLDERTDALLTDWYRRTRESQTIHYECGIIFGRRHLLLGIPAIVLSTAAGTAVFSSLETSSTGAMRIAVGLTSILAAVLAALQTFLGLADRADRHRRTGAGYGGVRRLLEQLKTFPPGDTDSLARAVDDIRTRFDALAEASPPVPSRVKKGLDSELKKKGHTGIFVIPGTDPPTKI
jgi:hypothetical protein